jgi:hypothetical protein
VITRRGNTETKLDLDVVGGVCTIVTPVAQKDVSVKKNKKITWDVKNACASAQAVMLGNFRLAQASTATDCANPTAGGAEWPFKEQDKDNRSVTVNTGDTGQIELKEAKNDTSAAVTYYFDVCLGGVKKDPRVVIEPY